MLFGQSFEPHDLVVVAFLVVLEGVLSIDNALVLGLLARRLPKQYQARALTYGLVGAFLFRFVAIATAAFLLQWRVVKLVGGGYLLYISLKHFFFESPDTDAAKVTTDREGQPTLVDQATGRPLPPEAVDPAISARTPLPLSYVAKQPQAQRAVSAYTFWSAVAVIELTDVAFAIDSILAAIGIAGDRHEKLWVIITGGFLGVVLMRFAAVIFIKLLERFPRFEMSAYLLVMIIGAKLVVDWWFNTAQQPHRVNFHSYGDLAFWVFWSLMVLCFAVGFIPHRKDSPRSHT
jgi:YkoY family integral membrane protein